MRTDITIKYFARILGLTSMTTLILAYLFIQSVDAAEVTKVKDKSVIMQIEGLDLSEGDRVYLTQDGKKLGLVEIEKIVGNKAKGRLTKGKAAEGMGIMARGKNGGSSRASNSSSSGKHSKLTFGILGGVSLASQTIILTRGAQSETISSTGTGFGVYGLGDIAISSMFGLRALAGYEMFKSAGSSTLYGATSTSINFLTFEGWGRFIFTGQNSSPIWAGAGAEIMLPLSKSSNALDANSISTTLAYGVAAGMDFRMSGKTKIPIQAEYVMLPSSSDVKTSLIRIRAGMTF